MLRGQVDRRLIAALRSMLEPDPDRRASSVADVLRRHGLHEAPPPGNSRAPGQATSVADEPRHESRQERKWRRRAERRARRHDQQHWRRPGRPVLPGVLLGTLLLFAFLVARVATFALFQVLLPTLFTILSVAGGRHLYRRGRRLSEIGQSGQRGLDRAAQHVRYLFLGGSEPAWLAAGRERVRISSDDEDEDEDARAAHRAAAETSLEARIEAELEAAAAALEDRIEGRSRRKR
jgi:hypothetical protein